LSSEYEEKKSVLLRKSAVSDLERLDGLILDIDGVILDVSSSFRVAISRSTQFYFTDILGWTGKALLISPAETQFFKQAGGFNNDWELTYAAVLFFLAKSAKFGNQNLDFLKNRGKSVKDFTKELAIRGGGLEGAQQVLLSTQKQGQVRQIIEKWDRGKIKQIFQEIYGGVDHCKVLYGFEPQFIKEKGLINEERALLEADDLDLFLPKIGIITGRTREEATAALKLAGLEDTIRSEAVLSDDGGMTKPDPGMLLEMENILAVETAIYVGDTIDDFRTVANYQKMTGGKKSRKQFLSGLITQREFEKQRFIDLGADAIAENPKQMLNVLSQLRKGG
jgi:HAD superfamily phosphatase